MPVSVPPEPVRLSKIVAEMAHCSRREAELYIEGGWVRVNGQVVDVPGAKVLDEQVTLDENAVAEPVVPVTIVLHKPSGFETWAEGRRPALQLLRPGTRSAQADRSGIRPARQHFMQECLTPLEPAASGLVIYSQDFRVRRKLTEDAGLIEHEVIVDVQGDVGEAALDRLNRAPVIDGRAMTPARVSISRQSDGVTGLRFASKGHWVGRIAQMLEAERLRIVGMRRIRVGRVNLAGLEPGEWRYFYEGERV
ncbi:RNA-binding protein [Xylophilus rhododendri]|uniref:Dual-specificity RNA pseudouridine synthase RluF n=1 Tax=Xylophilus rhododendri TaxID=2697032 RepID=A0A857J2L8_9BURK|nr:RNA pseudouridine synthase [Xylophilus rhododendri]QHI97887.1 RNA-binding protein [Xylophilus rhododendri]